MKTLNLLKSRRTKRTGCVFERYKSYRIYTCRHSDHIFIVVFIIIQCSAQNVEVLYNMNKEKGTHNNHEHIQESWNQERYELLQHILKGQIEDKRLLGSLCQSDCKGRYDSQRYSREKPCRRIDRRYKRINEMLIY